MAMFGTTTLAAPMTTTLGQPAFGAGFSGSYVAPASYAAPIQMAAPMTTAMPTTTAMPMTTAVPSVVPQMVAPQIAAPPSLTQGIPTPEQIAKQKAQFAEALDKQLKDAIA